MQPEVWAHVRTAEELWIERSARVWELDLSILAGAGITVRRPEPADAPSGRHRTRPPPETGFRSRVHNGCAHCRVGGRRGPGVVTKDRDFRDGHLLSGSPRRLMVVRRTVVSTLSISDRTAVTARTGASADRDLGAEVPVLTRPSKRPPCASRSPGSPSGPAPSRGPTRSSWWRVCNGRSPRGSPKAGKAASAPPGGRRCVGGVRRGRGGCGWLLS